MNVFQRAKRIGAGRSKPAPPPAELTEALDDLKVLAARFLIQQRQAAGPALALKDAEFKVFSQFGDDGIIQHLIHSVGIEPELETFIEFGVQDYRESNTRFLLINNNWRGLVMDASEEFMAGLRQSPLYWRHDLTAVAAFVDRENVNGLFREHGFEGPLGLLHIDIDGNDYWVWESVTAVQPVVAIVEYNSVFGAGRAVSVPYDAAFDRTRAHTSNLYWGASLPALCKLAERRGYAFVGCNSAGNNAYFVRQDRLGPLQPLTAQQGYVESRFRESRNAGGQLTFLGGAARRAAIADMLVEDVETGERLPVGSLT